MNDLNIALTDKVIKPYLDGKEYLDCSDEGEAVAIAAGHFIQTKQRANVYFSADGLCNALNFLTSWIIPEGIEMNLFISTGRQEPPHKVMTDILPQLLAILPYDPQKITINVIQKDANPEGVSH